MSKLSDLRKKKVNTEEHREWLINRYQEDLSDDKPFRNMVLTEGIRKLKESSLKPTEVERWTEGVIKAWRNIK